MGAETSNIPEYVGANAYPEAMTNLLDNRAGIGAVVIRQCFNVPLEIQRNRIAIDTLLPIERARNAANSIVRRWWNEQGYTDYGVERPEWWNRVVQSGSRIMEPGVRYGAVVFGFASLRGQQDFYVSPGDALLDAIFGQASSDAVDAYNRKITEIQDTLTANPQISSYEATFKRKFDLEPTDIALVMGHPQPAYHATRGRITEGSDTNRSFYAQFSYRLQALDLEDL